MLTANNIALTANDITGVAANADTPGTTTGPFGTPVSRTPAFRTPASPTPASVLPGGPASDTDPLGDEIATLCAHINAATYRLLTLLRVYDQEERWQGCRSCAHWLSWRTGISIGPAREKVRVARCLPSLPLISGALAKGEISYSKVRALTRVANADNETELLTFARHGTTAHVERLVREWRRLDRADTCQAARAERRGLSLSLTDDGSYEVRGRRRLGARCRAPPEDRGVAAAQGPRRARRRVPLPRMRVEPAHPRPSHHSLGPGRMRPP